MPQYYDGTKILSLMDKNGNKPGVYIVTTNRTGGKTTFFSRMLVKRFKKQGHKFMLVYRYKNELCDVANQFFKDINKLFFPDDKLTDKPRAKGAYVELFLNDIPCGYAVALNTADALKRYSHLFSDVHSMYVDEFQLESGHYCPQEIRKFLSLVVTVSRGRGEQYRYVPVYMAGNTVSILNPYYVALGISDSINSNTKFLRGDGFVLEQGFVDSASAAQANSPILKAFASSDYVAYNNEAVYLNDSTAFIETPPAKSKQNYICTIRVNGSDFAIREYPELAMLYCDTSIDPGFPLKIAVTTEDQQINYVMLNKHKFMIKQLRVYFDSGCFRFKNIRCKQAVLKLLAY